MSFFIAGSSKKSQEEKLKNIYYNTEKGYCGINQLQRKSKLPQKIVKEFLQKQDVYSQHFPAKINYERRIVFSPNIDDQFQADLVEMIPLAKENKNYKYILTCIDVFSKYAWAIPLKSKSSGDVENGFKIIFKERIPEKIQTDNGKEFYNSKVQRLFDYHGIDHFSTNSSLKATIVERFNRTLKEKMWKYFTEVGNKKYIDILDKLLINYNNSFHRSIKMTPNEASRIENKDKVFYNLYNKKLTTLTTKFKINDIVRISKYKNIFKKGYEQNYTTEIFYINNIFKTNPITYELRDYNDEIIKGKFYEQELVKYDKQDNEYEIEKVIKKETHNGKIKYFVKWKGYPENMNSWVDKIN